jgi:hypothetical protein
MNLPAKMELTSQPFFHRTCCLSNCFRVSGQIVKACARSV